ncbi:MAG: response regulator [Nocardioides sp.]|jgi:DNA-binding response OmpR family regulator|nr:response regulator [Nocardioides sp.]|tara:strand:- start:1123 stop:1521 length:399 start_codon:yes stop_codon:yes gene_type:complete
MVSAGRLLVAERDPELLELMVPVLRLAGHRVTAARDGLQALGLWRNQPFDLVVLDMVLPRLTGIEVLHEMRADTERTQSAVVMLSSLTTREEVRTGFMAGADEVLAVPFTVQALRTRVEELLAERALVVATS